MKFEDLATEVLGSVQLTTAGTDYGDHINLMLVIYRIRHCF
jgi:hypothetical protein